MFSFRTVEFAGFFVLKAGFKPYFLLFWFWICLKQGSSLRKLTVLKLKKKLLMLLNQHFTQLWRFTADSQHYLLIKILKNVKFISWKSIRTSQISMESVKSQSFLTPRLDGFGVEDSTAVSKQFTAVISDKTQMFRRRIRTPRS